MDRHLCSQEDKLERYGWVEHDGMNFGIQEISDKYVDVVTSFVKRPGGKHGGDWTTRVELQPREVKKDKHVGSLCLIMLITLDYNI